MGKAISRIERMAYTAENLAAVKASGRAWEADTNYIYAVRDSEVVYSHSVSGDYTANDHGQEIIEGGTVEVFVQTLYGQNLVDKLRTDVLTKSQDLVNNLTTNDSTKALSAAQGYALNSNVISMIKKTISGVDISTFTTRDADQISEPGIYYGQILNVGHENNQSILIVIPCLSWPIQIAISNMWNGNIEIKARIRRSDGTWYDWVILHNE